MWPLCPQLEHQVDVARERAELLRFCHHRNRSLVRKRWSKTGCRSAARDRMSMTDDVSAFCDLAMPAEACELLLVKLARPLCPCRRTSKRPAGHQLSERQRLPLDTLTRCSSVARLTKQKLNLSAAVESTILRRGGVTLVPCASQPSAVPITPPLHTSSGAYRHHTHSHDLHPAQSSGILVSAVYTAAPQISSAHHH